MWAIIAAVIAVAASAGVYYQQRKMEAQAKKQAQEAKAVQISGHDSNRGLYTVYGKALIGSTTVWKKVSDKQTRMTQTGFTTFSRGTGDLINGTRDLKSNRFLYRAVSLCAGPIQSVENILIDDEGYQSSRFGQGDNRHFAAAVSLGPTAGQNFSAMRTSYSDFNAWGTSFTGKGVAYAIERLYLDNDKPAYQGEPSTKYLVKGRKLYDPRKDSTSSVYDATLGTSSHRFATPTTWEWSDNPVLALLDYMTNSEYGRGLALSVIDLPSIAEAADKCDELVDIPARLTNTTGSSYDFYDPESGQVITVPVNTNIPNYRPEQGSSSQQKRFRINIAIDPSKELLDNIQEILNVFRGNLSYANGKYRVHMADVASPVLTIGDDDIITGLKISNGDRSQRMNRATVKFINANKQHKTDQASWPSLDSNEDDGLYDTYLTEDQGERLHKTFTIKGCTDFYQAQDTAEFLVRDSRSNLTVAGTFGSRCFGLLPGDIVSLTYDSAGYSGKYFRVMQVAIDLNSMNVNLQLKEYDSSVYTWNDARGNEPEGITWQEEVVNASPTTPVIGTLSSTTRTRADGSTALTLTVPFSNIPEQAQYVDVEWGINGTDQYNSQVVFDTENINQVEVPIERDNATYAVRVRYFIADSAGTLMASTFATDTIAVGNLTGTKLGGIEEGATANNIYQQDDEPTGGTYNDGDIWIDTNDGYRMYLRSGGAWVDRADTRIATAITDAAGAQSTADGKIVTFFQDAEPTTGSSGDLWIDTNDSNKLYRYNGTSWDSVRDSGIASAISAASTAQSTADGKIVTFYQDEEPAAASSSTGDLWFDTNDSNKLYRYNGTSWASARDSGIAAAISAAAGAQSTADGKVVTFYQDDEPAVASSSTGDLWIDTNDNNKLYRFNGTSWDSVRDAGIASAISSAATAQSTADGKIVTFYQDDQPAAASSSTGDLWFDTNDNNKLYRYNGTDWVSARDAGIATALSNAATAQSTADGKIVTFYQDGEPAAASSSEGDLWIDTNDNNKLYRFNGTDWQAARDSGIATAISDAATAQATADGKVTTFYAASTATPTPEGTGDLWYQTDTQLFFRYNGSAWQEVASYNTGDLADLDTVGTNQIDDNAVDITKIADTLQSTNYSAGSAGWKLTTDGTFEAGNGTFRGALTATSLDITAGNVTGSLGTSNVDVDDLVENASVALSTEPSLQLNYNAMCNIADSSGKPDGLYPVENVSSTSYVFLETENSGTASEFKFVRIDSSPAGVATDTTVSYAWKPFAVDSSKKYKLVIRYRSETQTSSGLYLRFNEYNQDTLPSGKTHLGYTGGGSASQLRTSYVDLVANGQTPPTEWVEHTFLYQPTSGTKLANFTLYNWSSNSGYIDIAFAKVYAVNEDATGVTILADRLYQGAGTYSSTDTGFYLDSTGKFSLKNKLAFNGTDLAIDGNVEVSEYIRAGSGSNTAIISGRDADDFAFWAGAGFEADGGPSGGNAPFRVTRDGKVIMTNFALYSEAGTKLFDSQDGLLALPQTAVAQASGALVPQVSEELTSGTDTFTVTLSSTQTITANFSYPVGALYYSGTSLTDAQNNVSSAFAVTLQYSSDSGATWNTFGSTQNFSKVTSGTPTSSQYLVLAREFTISIIYGATPTTIYVASLQTNTGAIDEGTALVGSTSQSLGAGTYLIRMVFSATGGSGSGAPSTTKTREIRLTTSGAGFTVSDGTVSDGVGTSATTGWVLSNFVEKTESDNVTINGTLTLGGDLVVNGTTTTINSTTLEVADKNIVLADGAANAAAADGAGITIDGASASLTYHSTTDSFRFNKATAFGFNNIDVDAFGSYAGGFGTVQDGSGWSARGLFVHGGGTGDGATIAHNGSGLYFGIQNNSTANSLSTWLYVNPSKVIDFSGTLSMSSTSFMDSSRNLSNIGTISSGAITASGTSAINNFRLTDSSKMGFGTVKAGASVGHGAGTDEGIFWHTNNDYGIYRTEGAWTASTYQQLRIKFVTGIEIDGGSAYDKSGVNIINSDLKIGGTTVLDTSRNATFNTISSGAITSTGDSAFGKIAVGTDNDNAWSTLWVERDGIDLANDWSFEDASNPAHLTLAGANAHVRMLMGTMDVSPFGVYIQGTYDNTPDDSNTGSSGVEPIHLNPMGGNVSIGSYSASSYTLDVTGTFGVSSNATFAGTISSGAITSSGAIVAGDNIVIGSGGTYQAGNIYSDANWGMIFRAKQETPTNADFLFSDYGDTHLVRFDGSYGIRIEAGGLQIGSTTVIDSSRNLTNIGTISSGAITASSLTTSGAAAVGGNLDVDGIIDNTRNNGSVAAPSTSDHTAGTRIKFFDANATSFYAMGIENGTLWFNSDANYKWYVDATLKVDFDQNGVVNAVGGYKVGGTEIINSSGSVVGAPTITLANNSNDTAAHRIAVYDSGNVSYGMMLWNDSGAAGAWGTMIYGPNQSGRTISFGKIIDSTFTNHGDVRQIAYFDLDNGNFVHKGQTGYDTTIRAYGQGSSDDALIQLLGQGNNPSQEGFEIWYDNDVGEVSLSTTYPNAAADMHFRTGTGASKSTSNTRLTLHGDGNATLYANPNSIASFQTIPSSAGYNYINIAGTDGNDSGIIFSEGDGNTATNRRMMIGYDASEDVLRFYTYYRSDGTTAVTSDRASIDTYGNFNIVGAYQMDGSTIIDANRQIDSSRSATTGHISKFNNTNTGTSAYGEIWVQNGGTSEALVLGYSKNYVDSEWSGKGWVYARTGPLALKTPSTLQIYTGSFSDAYISATYDSSGNYAHLRGNASFDNQVKIKASSHPSASGTALTVGDSAGEGLRFGAYGHLLSSDTHICHNIYYTGSAWAQISGSIPSSTIKMGSSAASDISFGYTSAGSTSINYAYEFPSSGKARFDTSLTIGGADIGTRNGLSVTSAGGESQAVFQSSSYGGAFGILSYDNATYLSQNLYFDGSSWVQDSYNGEQRNALLAIRTVSSGHGIYWYASDNGSGSWNVASNVQLFNASGYCTADITTNNFRSTAPHFLTSETLELGDYGSSWGHPYISMASSWAGGAYPTIGSTGGSAGSLIMLHNPHIPFRTDNNASGQTGKAGIRCASNANASTYYDIGVYSMTGVTEGFQIARGGTRYMWTTGGDDFIFLDNVYADGGTLLIGDQAFSSSANYVGMKTAYQSGVNDYMILSGTSDGNTYVSAKDGSSVNLRGGGNNSANQISIPDGTTITATTSNFSCSGNVTAYSDERLKSDVQTLDGAKVLAMRGVSFTKDGEAGSGVIAQELEKVAPELVHTADDEMGTKSVAYGNLVGYLIEAVKMQQQQIDELKALLKEKDNGND